MRFTSLASALLLAGVASLALAGEQAGDLPANYQAATMVTPLVEVIATGGHADTADHATTADTASRSTTSDHAEEAERVTGDLGDCPPTNHPRPDWWAFRVNADTGAIECVRVDGGPGNPNQ